MTDTISIVATTREAAHLAVCRLYEYGKALTADQKPVLFTAAEYEDDITARQRGFLHKAVFPQISEQVTFPDGARFEWRVWKEMFRARFLGDRFVMRAIPRWDAEAGRYVVPKRKTPHRERVSTEDLSIKQYSKYIDTVIDTAVVEFGVHFHFIAEEREGVRYVAPTRKTKSQPAPAEA